MIEEVAPSTFPPVPSWFYVDGLLRRGRKGVGGGGYMQLRGRSICASSGGNIRCADNDNNNNNHEDNDIISNWLCGFSAGARYIWDGGS